jgi:hypothetical protein
MHDLMQQCATLTVHQKFVPSSGVASRASVYESVIKDTETFIERPIQIYDRHPLISEYVYGPIVRGYLPTDWQSGSARMMRSILANHALVVWCMPNIASVRENVSAERDMKNVPERIDNIYAGYQTLRALWPGHACTYNYEDPHKGFVINRVMLHVKAQTDLRNEGALNANLQGVQQ